MSRVITFSRTFPSYHPRKGDHTYFVEKIWAGLADIYPDFKIPNELTDWDWHEYYNAKPKFNTIRSGHRFKVGDWFKPVVWKMPPYKERSKIRSKTFPGIANAMAEQWG